MRARPKPICRRYTVWVPEVRLNFDVNVTVTKQRLAFEVDTEGLLRRWRNWVVSPEGATAIGNAVEAHHKQIELEGWATLTGGGA